MFIYSNIHFLKLPHLFVKKSSLNIITLSKKAFNNVIE